MKVTPYSTAAQEGVTPSQPGCSVHLTICEWRPVRLNVCRYYPNLPNRFGGKGVIKPLDHDGREFATTEAAWRFAFEHGYTMRYFIHPALRAARVREARRPKK